MLDEKKPKKVKGQSQRERFIETAKKLEVDESGASFENVFSKVVPAKKKLPLEPTKG